MKKIFFYIKQRRKLRITAEYFVKITVQVDNMLFCAILHRSAVVSERLHFCEMEIHCTVDIWAESKILMLWAMLPGQIF